MSKQTVKKGVENRILSPAPERYRLVQDDDGHWYVIPAREEQQFEAWVAATVNGEDEEEYAEYDFNSRMLSGSPSNVTFLDPQED